MRSAEAIKSWRDIAEVRGMIVGARDARRALNSVGVRPDKENGVVERGGSEATTVAGDATGLGLRAAFSSVAARLCLSWSDKSSPVLVVLRFAAELGFRPTTIP